MDINTGYSGLKLHKHFLVDTNTSYSLLGKIKGI
jgi:hypothetical protein